MRAVRFAVLVAICLLHSLVGAADGAAPPLMLANSLANIQQAENIDLAQYWVSEKYDGIRGFWNGRALLTRSGAVINAPSWFTAGWPSTPFDGELWIGRGLFEELSAAVRDSEPDDHAWRRVVFMVFDLPAHPGTFDERLAAYRAVVPALGVPWVRPAPQFKVADRVELERKLFEVVAAGGEGLMLHRGDSVYRAGRSDDLLKLKPLLDAEARVLAHLPGGGKYRGMLGALLVERPDGVRFRIGTGFTDAQRRDPPPVGAWVTYAYSGVTARGLPRFARFVRVRDDPPKE